MQYPVLWAMRLLNLKPNSFYKLAKEYSEN